MAHHTAVGRAREAVPDAALGAIAMLAHYACFEGLFQHTPGKWITKTRVVGADLSSGLTGLGCACDVGPSSALKQAHVAHHRTAIG